MKIQVLNIIRKYRMTLVFSLILTVLFFGMNSSIEFATDSYEVLNTEGSWKWMLYDNGRLVNALVYYVIERMGFSHGIIYHLSFFSAMLFLYFAVCLWSYILRRYIENEYVCVMLSFLGIVNPYFVEYFLFIEKGLFLFAVLLAIVAAACMDNFFTEGKPRALILTFLALLILSFTYQFIMGLFVAACLPLILRHSPHWKRFLVNNIVVAGMYGGSLGINYLITRILFGSSRLGGLKITAAGIWNQCREILRITLDPFYYFAEGEFIRLILIVILSVCVLLLFERNGWAERLKSAAALLYIPVGCVFTAFFPYFIGAFNAGYAPRYLYPYACLFGMVLIPIADRRRKIDGRVQNAVALAVVSVLLLFEHSTFQNVFIDRYQCNQVDRYLAKIVEAEIRKYEEESGIEIETVCFYRDSGTVWSDEGFDRSGLNVRAQSLGWSDVTSLNYYLNEDFVKGEKDPRYEAYFSQLHWDTYSEEQLIFEGDTLHICAY